MHHCHMPAAKLLQINQYAYRQQQAVYVSADAGIGGEVGAAGRKGGIGQRCFA